MEDASFGLIEIVLAFGALLGWALWELRKTRRDLDRTKQGRSK